MVKTMNCCAKENFEVIKEYDPNAEKSRRQYSMVFVPLG